MEDKTFRESPLFRFLCKPPYAKLDSVDICYKVSLILYSYFRYFYTWYVSARRRKHSKNIF